MNWIIANDHKLTCLETSQELRLIKVRKGWQIHQTNSGIIFSSENEIDARNAFQFLIERLSAIKILIN